MNEIPVILPIAVAALLFAMGVAGVLIRRNIIFILMFLEVMLNAAGLAFITAGAQWAQPDGQILFLFIITMAAAEVAVGLALVLQMRERLHTLNSDAASKLKG